jgi:hypothetical protein
MRLSSTGTPAARTENGLGDAVPRQVNTGHFEKVLHSPD